ncbi:Chemotaxis protein methyltransferase CheR [Minicystis rosea]|nr:Chemotaxis protein methyltransferase CheR [Minicystis rosea]
MCLLDTELRFLACNEGLAAIGGRPREALIGRHLLEAVSEVPPQVVPLLRRTLETGEPTMGHEIVTRPGGRLRSFSLSCFRIALSPCRRGLGVAIAEMTKRREAQERVEMLLATKEMLDGSLDPELAAERLARLLVTRFADWCVVDLSPREGSPALNAIAHVDVTMLSVAQELRRRHLERDDVDEGIRRARLTGRAELTAEITEEALAEISNDPKHLGLVRALGLRSTMVVPLVARGRIIGVIRLAQTSAERRYDDTDLAMVRSIAARAALAIDNARLYRAEQEARRRAEQAAARVRRLQEVTTALSEATTPERVASIILHDALDALGAPRGVVMALSEDERSLETFEIAGPQRLSLPRRLSIDAPALVAVAFRTGAPQLCESGEAYLARFPDRAMPAPNGAIVAIPLILSAGRSIGAFAATFEGPRAFTAEERDFLITLGRQGAQALERARLHEAERRARLLAEEANRAKDEFLGVVSHELRTPLNAIVGWASLLLGKAQEGSMMDKGVRVIERNARAQAKIIDDILDVSRIITGKLRLELRPTDIEGALRAAADVVRTAADSKGVELVVEMPVELPEVAGDADRLQQIFWNLLSNAVKFTPTGGRVSARVEVRDGALVTTVTDTGEGIPAPFLPFVFDRFRQADASTSRRHGGLGLGLAIVRHLVELHGGEVSAESAGPGLGARFSVSLPLPVDRDSGVVERVAQPPPSSEDLAPPTASPLDGLRVLVVDDERDARDVIIAILTGRGAVVHAVGSAQDAVDALSTFAPDVLLSDIGMPLEDGFSLLRRVRALPSPFGSIPAIALTAYTRSSDARSAERAGFTAHLPKPVEANLLSTALLAAIGRAPARERGPTLRDAPASSSTRTRLSGRA